MFGWIPDLPDPRDLHHEHPDVGASLSKAKIKPPKKADLPGSIDLRGWFPPAYNQGKLDSCTANTTAGLVAYLDKRKHDAAYEGSRLFNYKAARDLLQQYGDRGAFLRTAMQSLATFGLPPEKYWPYIETNVNVEPPAFCYALGGNYKAIQYFRYDPPDLSKKKVLTAVRSHLATGIPSMFGFYVYSCLYDPAVTTSGKIPLPTAGDTYRASHAMIACGYDDSQVIDNINPRTGENGSTTGAFLVRNSWGETWGDHGYGWLPYDYLLEGLATDWWSLLGEQWLDPAVFSKSPPAVEDKTEDTGDGENRETE